MITKEQILTLVNEAIENTDVFIVEVLVSTSNKITILIDTPAGITIDKCVDVSRYVEHKLDRETEDFALDVSSPGLEMPLKVHEQYLKNIGRELIIEYSGNKITGKLLEVLADTIIVEEKRMEIPEGQKKKQLVVEQKTLVISEIKMAKVKISF